MKLIALAISASLFSAAFLQTASAQKLVDPDKVAPEFREAAIKRRAEQIKNYNSRGRVITRETTSGNTTIYDSGGRNVGRVTTNR